MEKPSSKFDALRSVAAAGIGATYVSVGAVFEDEILVIHICENTLDGDVVLSFDGGTTDHYQVTAGAEREIVFRGRTNIYHGKNLSIKDGASAASTGSIFFSVERRN